MMTTIKHSIEAAGDIEFSYDVKEGHERFVEALLAEYDKYTIPMIEWGDDGDHKPAEPTKLGDLSVYWNAYLGHEGFRYKVADLTEAQIALDVLGLYDAYVFEQYGTDYCNLGDLEVCEVDVDEKEGQLAWYTWYHPDTYETFDEYLEGLDDQEDED